MSRRDRESFIVDFSLRRFALNGTWKPSDAERQAAWELLIELSTRTAMCELADDQGTSREALTSLYGLFETTRGILRAQGADVARNKGDGNLSFGVIAVRILNDVLRPLLSEWHPRLEQHEKLRSADKASGEWEREWEHNAELRHAIAEIRPVIRQYVLVLAEAADVPELANAVLVPNGGPSRATAGPGLFAGLGSHRLGLGFRPQVQMVRWFGPPMLINTALKIARIKLGKLDARRDMKPAPGPTLDHATAATPFGSGASPDYWFDYIADIGDAFDPTMAVAWWAGRDRVERGNFSSGFELSRIPSAGMPRGSMLVLGGDEVYPYASLERYENQMRGPYRLALPKGARSDLLALPGNHDWYDNLEAFQTVFCSGDAIGGWRTHQDASWFSARLPHGWWLWALDTGLEGDLNISQRAYFAEMATKMAPGDQLILCTPVPHWHLREREADSGGDDELGRVHRFLDEVVPPFVDKRLFLAGDSHVYAHYVQHLPTYMNDTNETDGPDGAGDDTRPGLRTVHHVTSGGGGAFLHPTHNLAPKVPQSDNDPFAYQLEEHWPPRNVSRHTLGRSARTLAVDRQSPSLGVPFALLHAGFLLAAVGIAGSARAPSDIAGRWQPYVFALFALLVFGLALPAPNVADPLVHRAARRTGFQHGLVQLVVLVAVAVGAAQLFRGRGWSGRNIEIAVAASIVGGLLATAVFSQYLSSVNGRWRIHDNMAFSGRHIRGYKHFVRCRVDAETGDLTLFVLGLDTVQPGWATALAHGTLPPAGSLTLVDVIDLPR